MSAISLPPSALDSLAPPPRFRLPTSTIAVMIVSLIGAVTTLSLWSSDHTSAVELLARTKQQDAKAQIDAVKVAREDTLTNATAAAMTLLGRQRRDSTAGFVQIILRQHTANVSVVASGVDHDSLDIMAPGNCTREMLATFVMLDPNHGMRDSGFVAVTCSGGPSDLRYDLTNGGQQ